MTFPGWILAFLMALFLLGWILDRLTRPPRR